MQMNGRVYLQRCFHNAFSRKGRAIVNLRVGLEDLLIYLLRFSSPFSALCENFCPLPALQKKFNSPSSKILFVLYPPPPSLCKILGFPPKFLPPIPRRITGQPLNAFKCKRESLFYKSDFALLRYSTRYVAEGWGQWVLFCFPKALHAFL